MGGGAAVRPKPLTLRRRPPKAVTLRHDGSGAVLTAREEELLPTMPPVGGSAILLSGERAGEVGRVAVLWEATRTAAGTALAVLAAAAERATHGSRHPPACTRASGQGLGC